MEEFIQAISNVGFPIACCIMLYVQNSRQMNQLTEAVANNTIAIARLCDKLDTWGGN